MESARAGRTHLGKLGWDDARWESEARKYLTLWRTHYTLPEQPRGPKGGLVLVQGERASDTPAATARPADAPVAPGTTTLSRTYPVRLRTVDLGGPVHYADYGGSGRTRVLLHGLGGSYLNWLPAAPELAKHARVLALDLVGFGYIL
ncbi:alpha/beta fold hydrolase [Archangium sp.]|uniref:alpha/beta fold hydrolase n=1 Tax=Archangium sp. TaxID=1872627 RepID=UPI00389A3D85